MCTADSGRLEGPLEVLQSVSQKEHLDDFYRTLGAQLIHLHDHLGAISQVLKVHNIGECAGDGDLGAIDRSVDAAHAILRSLAVQIPFSHRVAPHTSPPATLTVLATAELLEHILLHCDKVDLLRAWGVNRNFKNTIDSSLAIQRRLGLLADEKCDIHFPLNDLPIAIRGANVERGGVRGNPSSPMFEGVAENITQISLLFDINRRSSSGATMHERPIAETTPRLRKMLICQPPINSVSIVISCCGPRRLSLTQSNDMTMEMVTNENGLTAGDLADAHARTIAEHRLCARAPLHAHDQDGFVNCEVGFSALVTPLDTEPMLTAKRRLAQRSTARTAARREHTARISPYIAAKVAG